MEAVIIAIAGTIAAYFSWRASQAATKSKDAAENVDRKTTTNHGKEPWEYLEMVQDVRTDILDLKKDMLHMREYTIMTARSQEDLHIALIEHTAQDSENFEALRRLIEEQVKA